MKIYMISLGCSKNQVDSEMMLGFLKNHGNQVVATPEEADLLMVNTCAFIQSAREEAINTILELAKFKTGNKKLVVLGCLSQRYKEELIKELPEVDYFMKIDEYKNVAEVLNGLLHTSYKETDTLSFIERVTDEPDYMTYVRISDGCLNRCAFCAIPLIRGRLKSRTIEDIKQEVELGVKRGVYEFNIISQDTTRYGFDLYKKNALVDLLSELVKIEGKFKLRLFYLYPEIVTDELISFIRDHKDKVMPYFDIPLQHSEDHVLKAMRRRGDRAYLINLIDKIRREIPEAIFRTTMLVGFPGETEEDVDNLIKFMQTTKFDRLGTFTYSPEEGTEGAKLEQIPEAVKNDRYNRVMKAQFYISLEKNREKIGRDFDVLIESYDEENFMYRGRSYGFAPDDIDGCIYVAAHEELKPGQVVSVRIKDADSYSLTGAQND
jgi:ribosomal protein S12 methylthiotransferase